jgi:1-phosphatidylinositol-4-phosphate 5-kinase
MSELHVRAELSTDLSCNIEMEVLVNGQDSHASGTNPGFRAGEIRLPNGDVSLFRHITGKENTPEGSGRYLWSDGCIYEGEWRRGMRHGQGKTGEYSGGYIDGEGTYTAPDNIIYKGRWKLNRKHGLGCQTYPNGDVFEGSWIQGEIHGQTGTPMLAT